MQLKSDLHKELAVNVINFETSETGVVTMYAGVEPLAQCYYQNQNPEDARYQVNYQFWGIGLLNSN